MNVERLLPAGVTPEWAITLLVSITAFGCVLLVWTALMQQAPVSARAKRLMRRKEELKKGIVAQPRRHALRSTSAITLMKQVAQRLNLLRSEATSRVGDKLARAGWRSREAVITFMFMKLCLPFVFGAVAFVLFDLLAIGNLPPLARAFAPVLGILFGFYAPELFVSNATQKREKAIQRGLPDALDLMVICAEAGLSLDASLNRVSKEVERACPELGDEIGLTAIEIGFLPERRKALENLSRRCTLPSIRGVVNTLLQTEKYGTPLANSLRVLSAEFRNERMLKAEEKAARLPAVLTVPMMLFIMPVLFIVLGGPAAIRIIDTLGNF